MCFIEWKLLREDAFCETKKANWKTQQTWDACIQYCETNQATILVYGNDNKNCACCNNPPGKIRDYAGYYMYQQKNSKEFRQLYKTYL